jgi:predicted AAA+ superfamily ATPase
MFRYAINDLKKWSDSSTPKPLVIRGARQVGKSTLVRLFCEINNFDLVEVNLEKNKLRELDNQISFSIKKVLNEIELVTRKKFNENSVLFLDEIQEQPLAFNRLRYFFEDRPGLKVITAGSLLDVIIDEANFSMPVGRIEYYFLGPLSFREFLMAKKEKILLEHLDSLSLETPGPQILHQQAVELLKEYYFVGGMPEAVKTFIESDDMDLVRDIQNNLLQTYRDDIPKYTKSKQGIRVKEVFDYVPAHLGEGKIKFNAISETNSTLVKEAISTLDKAQVIMKVLHTNASGLPLSVGSDESVMKLYFLDIGLYNASTGVQWTEIIRTNEDELLVKGAMAEQFVAQHLKYRNPKLKEDLHYWLRGGKKEAAEVDFIINVSGSILPVEVKAGSTGKMRSLWQFVAEKKSKKVLKFDLKYRDSYKNEVTQKVVTAQGVVEIKCDLYSLPLYAIERFTSFLS